jgi:hypothetical protein
MNLVKMNKGSLRYKYVLTIIDKFSRFFWLLLLITKKIKEVIKSVSYI